MALAEAEAAREASKAAAAAKGAATKEQKDAAKRVADAASLADLSNEHLSELSASVFCKCYMVLYKLQEFVFLFILSRHVCLTENELFLRKEEQLLRQVEQLQLTMSRLEAAETKLATATEPVSKKARIAGDLSHHSIAIHMWLHVASACLLSYSQRYVLISVDFSWLALKICRQ